MPQLCQGTTTNGKPCRNSAIDDSGFCRTHHPQMSQRPSTGMSFEERVCEVLRLLGYKTQRDVQVRGSQVDIVAEIATGIIPFRLLVECKDYRGDRLVDIEEVRDFYAKLSRARPWFADKGVFVTTNGFARNAREFAREESIILVVFSELETQLVDFEPYRQLVMSQFKQLPSSQYHVSLSGTLTEDYATSDRASFHRPLETLINRVLFERDSNKVAVLGNWGTGKTTFCLKYAHELAQTYDKNVYDKEDPRSRLPVVISLSEYHSGMNIQQLVLDTLQSAYGVRGIDPTLSLRLQSLGKFVLIFDGFDEMASKSDPYIIRQNLRELGQIFRFPDNKVILTCRTHFFGDYVADTLTDWDIVYVPEWGEPELAEYLSKRFGPKWREYLVKIHRTHNLMELSQTPLLLDMIAETLPDLGDPVRRTEVYRKYTDKWIRMQSDRTGARLDARQRRDVVGRLAVKLYAEGRGSCHFGDLTPLLTKHLEGDEKLDYLRYDVQTCTFLTREGHGHYGFKHKSFMEFFVACEIDHQIRSRSTEILESKPLPEEVGDFLVEMLSDDTLIAWLKQLHDSSPHQVLAENVYGLLISLGAIASDTTQPSEDTAWLTESLIHDLKSWIRRMTHENHIVDDVVGNVLLWAWEHRHSLTQAAPAQTVLRSVARYQTRAEERRLRLHSMAASVGLDTESWKLIAAVSPNEDMSDLMDEALLKLNAVELRLVDLCFRQGWRMAEAAQELGLTLNAAQTLRHRALGKIRRFLVQQGYTS